MSTVHNDISHAAVEDLKGSSQRNLLLVIACTLFGYAIIAMFWLNPAAAHGVHGHGAHEVSHHLPHFASVMPFGILLGCIAVLPLVAKTQHWWENNLHRFYLAATLALVTLIYYLFFFADAGVGQVLYILEHAILKEYIPFISLLFSLYVISGGIRISGNLAARPSTNVAVLTIGGLLASFIGTTGAAMLLIRPLLETNKERKHVTHTVVFFIFVVCNCGGCLLPIGDPPLFLGYLEGVPFLWTMLALVWPWVVVNVTLITIYYIWDRFFCYPKESQSDIQQDETQIKRVSITGWLLNVPLLIAVILAVALLDPTKTIPGTHWHPWPYLREIILLGLAGVSLAFGSSKIRRENQFNYHAILEVAVLFLGIFICMQPALQILNAKGASLGIDSPMKFFWVTGSLSAVLDNAPTYLVFFRTANAQFPSGELGALAADSAANPSAYAMLVAISLGAVFMGAMTYIGNGPNFMVKAIAEQSGVRMPSFFGFVGYSCCVLLPVLGIVTWLFL